MFTCSYLCLYMWALWVITNLHSTTTHLLQTFIKTNFFKAWLTQPLKSGQKRYHFKCFCSACEIALLQLEVYVYKWFSMIQEINILQTSPGTYEALFLLQNFSFLNITFPLVDCHIRTIYGMNTQLQILILTNCYMLYSRYSKLYCYYEFLHRFCL
jgi:hypothetical protein